MKASSSKELHREIDQCQLKTCNNVSTHNESETSVPWYYKLCRSEEQAKRIDMILEFRKLIGGRKLSKSEIKRRIAALPLQP